MDSQTLYIIIGVVLLITLVCYIIALVKSRKGNMTLTTNGWDMALLLTCPVLILVGSFMQENPSLEQTRYILWGVAGVCFIGSVIFSIVSNKDSFWKILCSILAKVFIVWLTMVIIMLLIAIFIFYVIAFFMRDRSEDDGEYILLKYDKFLKAYVGYKL